MNMTLHSQEHLSKMSDCFLEQETVRESKRVRLRAIQMFSFLTSFKQLITRSLNLANFILDEHHWLVTLEQLDFLTFCGKLFPDFG